MRNVEGYFRALTLTVAVIFLCACTVRTERPTPTKQFADELARQILAAKIHKVYLPNFSDRAGEPHILGRFFAATLSKLLSDNSKGFTVINRAEAHKYLLTNGWTDRNLLSEET